MRYNIILDHPVGGAQKARERKKKEEMRERERARRILYFLRAVQVIINPLGHQSS